MNSMTGYGRGELELGGRSYCVELRSYNNRFLDVKVRLPWLGKDLEVKVEGAIRGRVHRGRVEASAWETGGGAAGGRLQLDEALARDLGALLGKLAEIIGADLGTAARLVPPQRELVLADPTLGLDPEQTWSALEEGLAQALDRLLEMRRVEGQATGRDMAQHLDEVERLRGRLAEETASEPETLRARLTERIAALDGVSVDPERIAQEVALLADRCDVSEELARLESHIEQLRRMMDQDGPVGREIEFLLQEFNRELNTIGSKSQSGSIAHLVVQAKTAVERMREQAQNLE